MSKTPEAVKLGELLIKSQLIQECDLREAMQVSRDAGLPIGRVFVMSGYLSEAVLKKALKAQSMIKDGIVDIDQAIPALKSAIQSGASFEETLEQMGWHVNPDILTNKLGELLLDAQIVNSKQLEDALHTSSETGLPVGRVMVSMGMVNDQLMATVLNAQEMIRDRKVTREQAIQGLKSARLRDLQEQNKSPVANQGKLLTHSGIRLGELFVLAGILLEDDLMNVLELGLIQKQPLGQILIESGFINQNLLEAALSLQGMVFNATLNSMQAAEVLSRVHATGVTISQAISRLGQDKSHPGKAMRLGEFLVLAGLVTNDDIESAIRHSAQNTTLIGKMLLAAGVVDEPILYAALRCQFLVRDGFLKIEQAIIALNYCQRAKVSLDDAIQELGWTILPPGANKELQPQEP